MYFNCILYLCNGFCLSVFFGSLCSCLRLYLGWVADWKRWEYGSWNLTWTARGWMGWDGIFCAGGKVTNVQHRAGEVEKKVPLSKDKTQCLLCKRLVSPIIRHFWSGLVWKREPYIWVWSLGGSQQPCCIRPFLALWQPNKQPYHQLGDPSAGLLLTTTSGKAVFCNSKIRFWIQNGRELDLTMEIVHCIKS